MAVRTRTIGLGHDALPPAPLVLRRGSARGSWRSCVVLWTRAGAGTDEVAVVAVQEIEAVGSARVTDEGVDAVRDQHPVVVRADPGQVARIIGAAPAARDQVVVLEASGLFRSPVPGNADPGRSQESFDLRGDAPAPDGARRAACRRRRYCRGRSRRRGSASSVATRRSGSRRPRVVRRPGGG